MHKLAIILCLTQDTASRLSGLSVRDKTIIGPEFPDQKHTEFLVDTKPRIPELLERARKDCNKG
jgi:hypothetical protein